MFEGCLNLHVTVENKSIRMPDPIINDPFFNRSENTVNGFRYKSDLRIVSEVEV